MAGFGMPLAMIRRTAATAHSAMPSGRRLRSRAGSYVAAPTAAGRLNGMRVNSIHCAREFDPLCAFERSWLFQRLHAQISGGEQALSRGAIGMRLIAIDNCLDRLAANRSG
jgi:hypothetical protein